jgi:uncharacterized LabA/DUF88 family protein
LNQPKTRIAVFVDGHNLYHSLAEKKRLYGLRWLNINALVNGFTSSREQIDLINFYTAFYPSNQDKRLRHELYNNALKSTGVNIVLGEFKKRDRHCKKCNHKSKSFEEKQTDVNIAIDLLKFAIRDDYDKAVILSADSDLIPAVKAVKELFPSKQVTTLFPPYRDSKELKGIVDFSQQMKERHLKTFQLPPSIEFKGKVINKPSII